MDLSVPGSLMFEKPVHFARLARVGRVNLQANPVIPIMYGFSAMGYVTSCRGGAGFPGAVEQVGDPSQRTAVP